MLQSEIDLKKQNQEILKKILKNLIDYALIGLIVEEMAGKGDTYAKKLLEQVKKL